jgi:hypothetical protein
MVKQATANYSLYTQMPTLDHWKKTTKTASTWTKMDIKISIKAKDGSRRK